MIFYNVKLDKAWLYPDSDTATNRLLENGNVQAEIDKIAQQILEEADRLGFEGQTYDQFFDMVDSDFAEIYYDFWENHFAPMVGDDMTKYLRSEKFASMVAYDPAVNADLKELDDDELKMVFLGNERKKDAISKTIGAKLEMYFSENIDNWIDKAIESYGIKSPNFSEFNYKIEILYQAVSDAADIDYGPIIDYQYL